jgi:hypothetical protein
MVFGTGHLQWLKVQVLMQLDQVMPRPPRQQLAIGLIAEPGLECALMSCEDREDDWWYNVHG